VTSRDGSRRGAASRLGGRLFPAAFALWAAVPGAQLEAAGRDRFADPRKALHCSLEGGARQVSGRHGRRDRRDDARALEKRIIGPLGVECVDGGLPIAGGIIGAGADEIRWPRATRPGDTLRVQSEVLEARPSKSRPDQGLIRVRMTTLNQNDEPVQIMIGNLVVPRTAPV